MKNFRPEITYEDIRTSLSQSYNLIKSSAVNIHRIITTFDTYPIPVVMIELEVPPTTMGLFYYNVDGVENITKSCFDFKDGTLIREMRNARVLIYLTFNTNELYSVPVLTITYIILGGDLCKFSKQKLEEMVEDNPFGHIGMNGYYFSGNADHPDELLNLLLSPFKEDKTPDLGAFGTLKKNYVSQAELHFIYMRPILEVPPQSLFDKSSPISGSID